MKKILQLTISFLLFTTLGFCQTDKFWSANTESRMNIKTDKAVARLSFPSVFKLFNLNTDAIRQELFSVTGNHARNHSTVISLPNASGEIEQFRVVEASNFEPDLQARFPQIRAFSGKGITDRSATLKLSISPQGIQTMIFRTEKENEFIEPYSQDHTIYSVFKSQRKPGQLPWTCSTQDQQLASDINRQVTNSNIYARSGGDLKTMRLAQSCNAEYSNYFGATSAAQVALVLAAFNATLTRCNGIYEKDLALHLNLVAASTNVIYYNPATDPYTTLGQWNSQLQSTLTTNIGETNYDIGHMFGASGGGGNAGCIGCVCTNGSKGSGITSPADGIPQGDNFDIDYVAHEVGHQLGGNHTFSHSLEGSGVNKEVGSGITIMGYAGITSYDVAPHSIDIFHQASIAQIQANLATKTCPITTIITANNATPVVAAVSNYTIPISTPFALTGSATDANPGDVLTYCWEQNDNSTVSGANSVASPTKATGPNWLSFSPTTSPTRTFPKLTTILAGLFVTPVIAGGDAAANIEALSSVSRTLNFRLTVRDNAPYSSTPPVSVGQTQFTDMSVTVTNTSGPFGVSSPNTAVSWPGLSSQTITWTVNNTTAAPVSCANVKISLSTDGGLTFPTVLAASTANDGSEVLTIPNLTTTTARIKVEAVGNIFFDISNSNFTITNAAPDFDFDNPAATSIACSGPTSAGITLGTISILGYNTPINLSASGVPSGTTLSFSINPVVPGNSTVVTLNNTNTLSAGTYNITITGVSGSITHTRVISYVVLNSSNPSIGTQPSNQTVCAGSNATFTVVTSGTVTSYQWQVSTDGGTIYNNVPVGGNSASYVISAPALSQNNYKYKVIVSGQCNTVTSNPATLTVNPVPSAVTITPATSTICPGNSQVLTANGGTTGGSANATLGTATTLTSQTQQPTAFCNRWSQYWNQTIYTAAELMAAGLSAGSIISSITYNTTSQGDANNNTNFSISIGTSSNTILTSFITNGLTTVYGPASYTHVIGLNTINFSTPYTWNGSSNLIIDVRQDGIDALNNAITYYTAAISNMNIAAVTSTLSSTTSLQTLVANATVTPSASVRRLNIILGYSTLQYPTWSWLPATGLNTTSAATVSASPITTTTYTATATNSFGCNSSNTSVVNMCSTGITVNLKLLLQGYYDAGSDLMQPVLNNQAVPSSLANEVDTITVELHDPSTFALIDSKKAVLLTDGTVSANFTQPAGSYYVAIKHRNTLQIWTTAAIACTSSTPLYNFSTAANKAMGDNQVQVEPGVWALFTGDLNQDDFIDGNDFPAFDTDSFNGVNSVYVATDMNGDGFVDGNDFPVFDVNSFNGVSAVHP